MDSAEAVPELELAGPEQAAPELADGPEQEVGSEELELGPEELGLGPEDLGFGPEELVPEAAQVAAIEGLVVLVATQHEPEQGKATIESAELGNQLGSGNGSGFCRPDLGYLLGNCERPVIPMSEKIR